MPSSDDVSFTGIPAEQIAGIWPKVVPFVEGALKHFGGKWNADDVRASLELRQRQLWVAVIGIDVIGIEITSIDVYPRRTVCSLWLTAGKDIRRWGHFVKVIENWAKENGCSSIEGYGRLGWKRLSRLWQGYELRQFVFQKEL